MSVEIPCESQLGVIVAVDEVVVFVVVEGCEHLVDEEGGLVLEVEVDFVGVWVLEGVLGTRFGGEGGGEGVLTYG